MIHDGGTCSRSLLKKYSGSRAGVFRVRDKEEGMRRCQSIVDGAPSPRSARGRPHRSLPSDWPLGCPPTPYRAEPPRRPGGVLESYSGLRAGVSRVRDKKESASRCTSIGDRAPTPYRAETPLRPSGWGGTGPLPALTLLDRAEAMPSEASPWPRPRGAPNGARCSSRAHLMGYGGTGPSPTLALLDVAHGYALAPVGRRSRKARPATPP